MFAKDKVFFPKLLMVTPVSSNRIAKGACVPVFSTITP